MALSDQKNAKRREYYLQCQIVSTWYFGNSDENFLLQPEEFQLGRWIKMNSY